MNKYRHHVSGFFANLDEAESARSRLVERGLPRTRLQLFDTSSAAPARKSHAGSAEVLQDIVTDGAVGVAVGTALGGLAELALVAANVSLFIASPLIAPLAMLGWGAGLGGFLGAAAGAGSKEGGFSALVVDAISNGQVVLVAETITAQETDITREVMQVSVNNYRDVSVA
jgi:hypothetical protein